MISKLAAKAVLLSLFFTVCGCGGGLAGAPYQTTGIRIGEVTDNSAIVWTRLTRNAERLGSEAPMPQVLYRKTAKGEPTKKGKSRPDLPPVVKFPDGSTIDTIEGAVPGAPGRIRVLYRPENTSKWKATEWRPADPQSDYTNQFKLTGLKSNVRYQLRTEARALASKKAGQVIEGGFRTAPPAGQSERVLFTVSTGQAYPNQDADGGGYKIYAAMLKLDPSFFVHTGDILYYDKLAKTLELARWHWQRTYSLATNVEFHRQVGSYFIKDDHDTWRNDCWPTMGGKFMGDFTFKQGQAVFLEQAPMGERTWRTHRWGKDLQIWMVEGRDFRSPNPMADGPDKTIWGAEQKAWFKRTVEESDATFRILVSPTPLVGPDRTNKNDNHANVGFTHEGNELRQFISKQKNMYVLCGDRHWQYVSVNAETGVREYSCGPASNKHAGGWTNDMRRPEHRYLNVTGGFLAVTIDRPKDMPVITFRHHSVDGGILNEDRFGAE